MFFSAIIVNNNTDDKISPKDSKLDNDETKVIIAIPVNISRDPRLENGSVFAKTHCEMNPLNTPVSVTQAAVVPENIKFTPSPSTPTAPHPIDQSLQDNSQVSTMSNLSHEPQDNFSFPSFMAKFISLPLETVQDPIIQTVINNMSNWQPREYQEFVHNNNKNDYNDNGLKMKRGFGCANNEDHSQSIGFRGGFRNNNRNNHRGYGHNNFRRRNFENNNYDSNDDYNENRFNGNRGFGNRNRYNNRRYNENRSKSTQVWENKNEGNNMHNDNEPFEGRGFGNANGNNADSSTSDSGKIMMGRGFGNANNNNNMNNDNKPLTLTRGFGNSDNYINSCNGNNSRPRLNYNRGNRFGRSDPYPRKFNNNYENDRYSNNFTNRGASKGFSSDAPGKMVDNQRFYHPSKENTNEKIEEEESWD